MKISINLKSSNVQFQMIRSFGTVGNATMTTGQGGMSND